MREDMLTEIRMVESLKENVKETEIGEGIEIENEIAEAFEDILQIDLIHMRISNQEVLLHFFLLMLIYLPMSHSLHRLYPLPAIHLTHH